MWRSPIEEGEYEIDTISLLADHDSIEYKTKALDRSDIILEWIGTFNRRQLRIYREPIQEMLLSLKDIVRDIEDAIGDRSSDENSN